VFPTHRSAGAAAGGGAAAAFAGEPRTTDTAGAMAKHGSRSTGAIPVLPALSSTVPADNGASSSSVGNPASEEGPKRRGSSFDRKACGGGGGERRRRKQRRGNHDSGGGGSASLREEACADLSGMARPGLWQSWKHGEEEREAGQQQLERLRERFKADRKVCLRSSVKTGIKSDRIAAVGL